MKCVKVRKDKECVFAIKNGCSFINNTCNPIVDECNGCENTIVYDNITYCKSYMDPKIKWVNGRCPMCSVKINIKKDEHKLNPIKASKKLRKK